MTWEEFIKTPQWEDMVRKALGYGMRTDERVYISKGTTLEINGIKYPIQEGEAIYLGEVRE
jgi:hypothetical protein